MTLSTKIQHGIATSLLVVAAFGCDRSKYDLPNVKQDSNPGGQVAMSVDENVIKSYELSGGSTVDVLKPFGNEIYTAVVTTRSDYPAVGNFAKNVGRAEHIYVISGEYSFIINNEERLLKEGEAVFVRNGDTYQIKCKSGEGKLLVTVKDELGGKTEIVTMDKK